MWSFQKHPEHRQRRWKVVVTWRYLRRLIESCSVLVLFGVIAVGAIELSRQASRPSRMVREHEGENRPGGGIIVRHQVLELWMPGPLLQLSGQRSESASPQNHSELRRLLGVQGFENLWYAFTVRGHQVNGDFADITFIRHPYREPEVFQEFLNLLATAAGNSPCNPGMDYTKAVVHIMSWQISQREPLEVIQKSPP